MDTTLPMALLGGLSPAAFMRRHWQKKPLLVRRTMADALAGMNRRRLLALAARDDIESRLVVKAGGRWSVRHGSVPRRAIPARARPDWTLLVQGVDLHDDSVHRLLGRFRFVGDARLDDAMLSLASDGGGVGPHVDSYDVFLLQISGRRRWRIGQVPDAKWRDDVPLKMLAEFTPQSEWVLDPGDMLYLPPGWAHDGIAVGECITCSIGFRVPDAVPLAAEVIQRVAESAMEVAEAKPPRLYSDRNGTATQVPARIAPALQGFVDVAIARMLADARLRRRALGEVLSEPKPGTWFERDEAAAVDAGVVLDRRTRMLYDDAHVFVNGESFRAAGRDAELVRRLADERRLDASGVSRLGTGARDQLRRWAEAGWCKAQGIDREQGVEAMKSGHGGPTQGPRQGEPGEVKT